MLAGKLTGSDGSHALKKYGAFWRSFKITHFSFLFNGGSRIPLFFRYTVSLVAALRLPVLRLTGLAAVGHQTTLRAKLKIRSHDTTVGAFMSPLKVFLLVRRFLHCPVLGFFNIELS